MRHAAPTSAHQSDCVHRPIWMAHFICFSIVFLPLLGYPCLSQSFDSRGIISGRAYKKEVGYGRPVLAMANSPRCTFNGKPVEDGKTVSSPEPCLNCTCSKGILLCYLHTCNSIAPTPGCQIVKKPDTCCPQLECDGMLTYHDFRTERTSEPSNKLRFRQEDNFFGLIAVDTRTDRSAVDAYTTRRPSVKGHKPNFSSFLKGLSSQKRSDVYGQSAYEQEEDIEDDDISSDQNNSSGYCYSRGYKYAEGMAMLSPTKCEYCYCIGGQQMCVRPKCHLNIEGCVPRYQSGYTCCPSHYNCEIASGASALGIEEKDNAETENKNNLKNKVTSCNVEGYDFDVGVAVPSNGHCQTCYCTQVGVVCRRLECSPSISGCTPVIPEGHCCPTQYKCDQKHVNNSHVPVVPHSTDNYDVTVISSIDPEGTSSQSSRTEISDLYTETAEHSPTTYAEDSETATETSSEKQKITVELPSESDLESISVIPEENIAVLVLTTDKEDEGIATSAEITSHTSTREDITTKLVPTTVLDAKRKSKPTKLSNVNSKIRNSTRFTTLNAATDPLTITTNREETTQGNTDSIGTEKDIYAYDYEEYEENASPDISETFSPFSDYMTPSEETLLGESSQERSPISNKNHKIKQKKPSTFQHLSTTKITRPSTNDEFFNYDTKETEFTQEESTYSTNSRSDVDEIITDDPTRYTIYSSSKTRIPGMTTKLDSLITRPNVGQKTKKRRPGLVNKYHSSSSSTKPNQLGTGSALTLEEIYNLQTVSSDTNLDKKTFLPYATETITETYRRHTRPSQNKKISNGRRQPENSAETTILTKTTKPIPQDIAEFLWSITQTQNTQTSTSSTETGDSTTKQIKGSSIPLETLPPIALAAPKLIMEAPTSESAEITTEIASINDTTVPSSPSFNFQPEIIFSNHGPSQVFNRKQPLPVTREPEVPLIINNHKRTSTRLRPPIRLRPAPTTASVENTFVEISNHRPTNTVRRPPSKFPPFPSIVSRLDGNYNRDTHTRDSHPKLHRIESDYLPEWSDDYEEDYYNSDHDHSTLSKIFNNIHTSTSVHIETSQGSTPSENSTKNEETSETVGISATEAVPKMDNQESKQKHITLETPEQREFTKSDHSKDEAEFQTTEKTTTEVPVTTESLTTTTPIPKTTYYTSTITTTTPEDTTKSFSGYVRNKYKGTSTHIHESEPKFFRADDDGNNRRRDSDYRFTDFGNKPAESFNNYPQIRPTLTTEAPTESPKEQEDSSEITDVCFVEGRYYTSGETIIKSNPCEMCRCFYGHPLCQVQQCPPPPDPSCALDYLPGYCCPQVTCGLETDPDQPPGIVSLPEPTSQEIRRSDMDNQWKPLPHGPLIRTTESTPKTETPDKKPDVPIQTYGAPQTQTEQVSNVYVWAGDTKKAVVEPITAQPEVTTMEATTIQTTTEEPTTTTTTPSSTTEQPTTIMITTSQPLPTTKEADTYKAETTTSLPTTLAPFTEVDTIKLEESTTTPKPLEPVFDPSMEENKRSQNKSGIHDNSSGVRKILGNVVTLPPSKVELSLTDASNIITVLPVIITMPTTVAPKEESEKSSVTMDDTDVGVVTELGGNLKVSGCNVYGKYYKINDKVTALSKPCSDCICSADGIACNATC